MFEKYEVPDMEVVCFDAEDVIVTSVINNMPLPSEDESKIL